MIRKFLLADDDQDDTDLFREALKGIDTTIECHFAYNGKEVLQKLGAGEVKPQLIFLDINMPEMNGWECLEFLKKEDGLKHIPVIMYSTSPLGLYGRKAIRYGALGFYEKPASFMLLKDFLGIIARSSASDLKKTLRNVQSSGSHVVYTE